MRKEALVSIAGTEFTVASDDDYLEHVQGEFEPETTRILSSIAHGTALDIGANIGVTAILLGSLCERVHAYEPSPTTYAFLRENVDRAGRGNITCHNYGLGSEAADLELTFSANNRSGAFVSNQTTASAGHIVESIRIETLDAIANTIPRASVIKMDVEGFEGHVLRGGAETIQNWRPVVAMELNHWCLNAFQRTSVPDFFDQLLATFPIVLAVHQDHHLNVRDPSDRYKVMHRHILHSWYQTLVCAFEEEQVAKLRDAFPAE